MIPLSKVKLDKDDIYSVISVLKSGQLAQGKKVKELEKKFAKLCGVKYAVAVNSGTAALHSALYSCGIKRDDEVITTPFTFVATANSILMVGGVPVFVDIDEKTYNLDPEKIEQAITKKTKAIILVNLYGQPADYDKINKIAKKNGLIVIEDAAQSINARYKNKKSGNLGDIGCFSFYATKNIMSGEGGMITTNNKLYHEKASMFRHHGQNPDKKYEYHDIGYNYRMTDFVAALALSQLKKVEKITIRRQNIAHSYTKAFRNLKKLITPSVISGRTHVYHQYVLRILKNTRMSRDALRKYLDKQEIETNIHYPKPLYEFKHFQSGYLNKKIFLITEKIKKEVLSIPVNPHLKDKEVNYIIDTIIKVYE